jgi:hypothetical protein
LTETSLLQGEIDKDPGTTEMDVELLLELFLRALIEEQKA